MTDSALFRCDGAQPPPTLDAGNWDKRLEINRLGRSNLNLRIENVSHALKTQLSWRATDLLQIAAYVYAADQMVSRGSDVDVFGDDWRRELHLCLPVSDPDFWSQPPVVMALETALNFATEDAWSFNFSGPVDNQQLMFQGTGAELNGRPDSVFLFSGGADSLGAVVQAVENGQKPLLLSHRSASVHDRRQQNLRDELKAALPAWEYPHVSVWAHRRGGDADDYAQRSRAFLFAALASGVAEALGINEVVQADNGIVSLNLPISQQVIGARASRSTHPKFLHRMNQLLCEVFSRPAVISNTLWNRTRPECMQILKDAGVPHFLQSTNSCAHWTRLPAGARHCGVCSQCVDRRFAAIAARMEQFDLAEGYAKDIFRGPLTSDIERTLATSYVGFARRVRSYQNENDFLTGIRELPGILPPARDNDVTMNALISMLKRHADCVIEVLSAQIAAASPDAAEGRLPSTCLVILNRPTIVEQPLELRGLVTALPDSAEMDSVRQDFKSRLHIRIDGRISARSSNIVSVAGQEAHIDDADFVLFLRLVLGLWQFQDGYVSLHKVWANEAVDGVPLIPRGYAQALNRLRKYFRGRVGGLSHLEFIENQNRKVRLSCHRELVVVNCEALLRHDNVKVRQVASLLNAAIKQAQGPD